MSPALTDESLMAFADGELAPAEEAVIRAAVEADPDLADRVALFRDTRRLAKGAFDRIAHEPVPETLVRAIVPAAGRAEPARLHRVANLRAWRPALAASLLLAAGLAGYALRPGPATPPSTFAALSRGEPVLAAALEEGVDGARRAFDGGAVRVGSTFRLEGGRTCRTFELRAEGTAPVSGLSCREDGAWRVSVATPGRLPEAAGTGGYRPASGDATDLSALLDARHADGPLPADEVERLRASGWAERR